MSAVEPIVRCSGVARTFGSGPAATVAVQPLDCEVHPGELVALMGPSGSGKSTLLHLIAGLDEPTGGSIAWPALGERPRLRPGPVAMIFQAPSLLPPLTVVENTALPLILEGSDEAEARERALAALERLGLAELADKLPEEISGGQAQRVAAARVLAGRARLVLADEPTGQLDRASGDEVVGALIAAARATGAALVVATHDPRVAGRLERRWEMHGGRLQTEQREPAWSR
jgi:putative ABC transport system ATP-binding protein/lipoprotein-releasing system ATP-binding protein